MGAGCGAGRVCGPVSMFQALGECVTEAQDVSCMKLHLGEMCPCNAASQQYLCA